MIVGAIVGLLLLGDDGSTPTVLVDGNDSVASSMHESTGVDGSNTTIWSGSGMPVWADDHHRETNTTTTTLTTTTTSSETTTTITTTTITTTTTTASSTTVTTTTISDAGDATNKPVTMTAVGGDATSTAGSDAR
jgi:hypothetical protein